MFGTGDGVGPGARELAVGFLIAVCVSLAIILRAIRHGASRRARDGYSVGFQIGPEYPGSSSWDGTPYILAPWAGDFGPETCGAGGSPACGESGAWFMTEAPGRAASCGSGAREGFSSAAAPDLVYKPPITNNLRGDHPNWWRPDGGSYGLPPAADRPDFWAGDLTVHTYHAKDSIPPLCESSAVARGDRRPTAEERTREWRYYGGPKGWNFSPYY